VFPVPLTILVAENKAMSKWVKILIIGAAWLFYFGIVGSGAGNA
jgi:hypothetical protein